MGMIVKFEPTPRRMALFVGIVGAFGIAQDGFFLVSGDGISRPIAALGLLVSVLFIVTGFWLWHASPLGWWFAWAAMFVVGLSGFAVHPPAPWPPEMLPPLFFVGFMPAAAGIFFSWLVRPEIYGPIFSSTSLPHAAYGAAPVLLLIAGAAILALMGGPGLIAGSFVLVSALLFARWLFGPLWALFSGRKEWHSGTRAAA